MRGTSQMRDVHGVASPWVLKVHCAAVWSPSFVKQAPSVASPQRLPPSSSLKSRQGPWQRCCLLPPSLHPPAWIAGPCLLKDLGPTGKQGETWGSEAHSSDEGGTEGTNRSVLPGGELLGHTGIYLHLSIWEPEGLGLAWEPWGSHSLCLRKESLSVQKYPGARG